MSVSKTQFFPEAQRISNEKSPHQEPVQVKRQLSETLENLRAKALKFDTLKKEGLIHEGRHLAMERQLRETIEELEVLIPQLEVCDG